MTAVERCARDVQVGDVLPGVGRVMDVRLADDGWDNELGCAISGSVGRLETLASATVVLTAAFVPVEAKAV